MIGNPLLSIGWAWEGTDPYIAEVEIPTDQHYNLQAGQTYWFIAGSSLTGVKNVFSANDTFSQVNRAFSNQVGVWNYQGEQDSAAFELLVAPVPEPATLVATLIGIAPLALRRKKRKAA